jgi:hypothetical protein
MIAILVAALLGVHQLKKLLTRYTDTQAMTLPQSSVPSTEADAIQKRVDDFREALRAGKPTPPLTLTTEEINSLISTDPQFIPLEGKVFVSLEGNLIKGQLSLPLEQIGLPRFRGHYLNGTGTFSISLQDGVLHIMAEQIAVKGQPLPATYLDAIRQQNLAANINQSPGGAAALRQLESVRVEDGKLILVPKVGK